MKIALAFPGCHRRGGIERVLVESANFLSRQGHETHVYASHWDPSVLQAGVVPHHVTSNRWSLPYQLSFIPQSQKDLRRLHPAADVLCGFGAVSPVGGVAWAQSVHRAWIEISGRRRPFRGRLRQGCNPFHPLMLRLERTYYGQRRYKKVVALTQQVKEDLIRFYNVPGGDIVIIPNGYSPEEFHLESHDTRRSAIRQKLGYNDQARVVIFVANELERKGFGPLLRGIARLHDPNVCLLVVGRVLGSAYAGEIESLGLSKRVLFAGTTSRVADYYAAADVFALPTQYEAWGLVIVEALACGLPVLTSRLAGAAVAVQEGKTGLLLDNPDDGSEITAKLQRLLGGDMRGTSTGREEIAASVGEYTWDRVLPRYEDVLKQQCG